MRCATVLILCQPNITNMIIGIDCINSLLNQQLTLVRKILGDSSMLLNPLTGTRPLRPRKKGEILLSRFETILESGELDCIGIRGYCLYLLL